MKYQKQGILQMPLISATANPASLAQEPLRSLEPRRHTSCMAPYALRLLKKG